MKTPAFLTAAQLRWNTETLLSKALILGILLSVIVAYLPTLQFDYVPGDQWRAFTYQEQKPSYKRLGKCVTRKVPFFIRTGRPLVWIGECIEHAAVSKISDFVYLRPFALAIALATALYLGAIIAPLVGSTAMGVAIASLFVLLPGYAFMYFLGMNGSVVLLSLLPAIASLSKLNQLFNSTDKPQAVFTNRSLFKPGLLFVVACMMYPAWAFVVIPLAWLYFGFDTKLSINKRAWRFAVTIAFFFIATIAYFAIIKLMIAVNFLGAGSVDMGSKEHYELSPVLNLQELINRWSLATNYLLNEPLLNFTFGSSLLPVGLLAYSGCIGYEIYLCQQLCQKKKITSAILWMVATFAISIIVLSATIAPWLFSSMPELHPRFFLSVHLFSLVSISVAIWILANKLFIHKSFIAGLLVGLILTASVAEQNKKSFLEVTVSAIEIDAIRSELWAWLDNKGYINSKYLLLVPAQYPHLRPSYIERLLANTKIGTAATWAGDQTHYSQMVTAILRERPDHPVARTIEITNCAYDQTCVDKRLAEGKVVFALYDLSENQAKPVKMSAQPFIINLSLLTTAPIIPAIEVIK